jgi:uncharacterized membrane protein
MKKNKQNQVTLLVHAAMIAALYVVLTFIANALGLASSAVQIRFSEALTILPYFTPAAIPGLLTGCLLSNILTGCALPDIIFGSLATLIGAVFTRKLRKYKSVLAQQSFYRVFYQANLLFLRRNTYKYNLLRPQRQQLLR